jgi:hypothetical protein
MYVKMRKDLEHNGTRFVKGRIYHLSITRSQHFVDVGAADVTTNVRIMSDGTFEEYRDGEQFNRDRSLKQFPPRRGKDAIPADDDEDPDEVLTTQDRAMPEPPRGKGR